ncbi:MAG TPA: PAS domain S-box protein, partial [Paludibacter sp.]|nr:PAS domain S-box protein [Paludibacter sp.]
VKAEESLRISEKKFRNLFQNHVAVKIIIDPDTGNIIDANFAASRFYGWSIDELKQMKIGEINTASPEVMQKTFKQVLAFGKVSFEFQHRCKDGSMKEVEMLSSKIEIQGKDYFHAIVHDVTDKKKAEEQIRLLSLTIEQSPIMVLITDPQAKIKYVNPSFINTTGYSRKEVIGENPRIFNSSMQSREFYLKLWETILAGKHWSGEFQDRKKNGEIYWVEASISPLMNEIGQITHFVMIKEDISEKRKMMEDLIKAKEKAEASDRLKTAFMNNISHEIRTPLNSIQGFAPLIIDPTLNVDEKQEFIKIFNLSSLRLIETITDYMDISLITSDTMDVVKDDFYLEGVIKLIKEQFHLRCREKKLILSFDLPEDIHSMTIYSDEGLLLKILIHLMDNAIKFTKSGEITVGVSAKDNFYEFFVRDTGKGIKKEYLSSIFKHFVQEDESNTRAYEGSGLGLAIVNGLVTLLGGSIRVDSEKGIGSTFTFNIQS